MSTPSFNPASREGEHVILVRHLAVIAGATRGQPVRFTHAEPLRRVRIGKPARYSQHPVAVHMICLSPRTRVEWSVSVIPNNSASYTIENEGGEVFYDSRQDVPCDMAKFAATRQRFAQGWRQMGYDVIEEGRMSLER